VIWPKAANAAGVQDALAAETERSLPVFAVHRRALAQLDPDGSSALAQFWFERGLFGSRAEADRFIADFQQDYRRQLRRQQVRDLPVKVRTLPRKLKRRTLRRLGRA